MSHLAKDIPKKKLILTGAEFLNDKKFLHVCLGDWIYSYFEDNKIDFNIQIIENPWDDRKKLFSDHKYLQSLYFFGIKNLSKCMNKIHNVEKTDRYWEIIIGPWLSSYLAVLYDRFDRLKIAFKKHNSFILHTNKDISPPGPPVDAFYDYYELIQNDNWNHSIFLDLINFQYSNKIKIYQSKSIKFKESPSLNWLKKDINFYSFFSLKKIIKTFLYHIERVYLKINLSIGLKPKIYLNTLSFGRKSTFLINILLFQDPFFKINFPLRLKNSIKKDNKRKINLNLDFGKSDFERFLSFRILKDIPMELIEYYEDINNYVESLYNPKIIVSDGQYWSNSYAKFWMAHAQENGTKLLYAQHGGSITQGTLYSMEFEERVSDNMITWTIPVNKKHLQLPPGKYISTSKRKYLRTNQQLLIIGIDVPRYIYRCHVNPGSSQLFIHYNQVIELYSNLPSEIKSFFRVRATAQDQGWKIEKKYVRDLGINHITKESYTKSIQHSKLIICTYPETTFSDCVARDIPVILMYPDVFWELNDKMRDLYKILRDAKIIFHNPKELSRHINEIWADPLKWWKSAEVKKSINIYKEKALNVDKNGILIWSKFLKGYSLNAQS